MPIYEYKCKDCGKVSEFLVGVGKEQPEIKCSFCKSKNLDKIISGSFISTSGHIIGSQGGKTCCGRTERCDTPPCSDGGVCKR
jgi:putative FmdB family regulatory protein